MTEAELIMALLAHPAGFAVSVLGVLFVDRMENGDYRVSEDQKVMKSEVYFKDVGEAARYFLAQREALKLGYDFEKSP